MRIALSSPDITDAEVDAVTAVLRTNRLSLGPELEAFEQAMAAYHGVPHAVAVSSGTAGLHLALLALNIGEGCEVIVPSFTFVAVANAVLYVRATPVFVDIDPITLNLDPARIEEAITPRTRAIIIVHTFGVPAEMDRILDVARRRDLAVIEDACEAIGAEYDSRRVGGFGDAAVFAFYPNKQITTGEGGCVVTRNSDVAGRIRSLRNQGKPSGSRMASADPDHNPGLDGADWFEHVEIGFNYRLSELACALGRAQLGRIDEILGKRQAVAERYQALLQGAADQGVGGLQLPPLALPRCSISWFVYVVRLTAGSRTSSALRDRIQKTLSDRGIATGRYFAPIHQQPAWRDHPSSHRAYLPQTEAIARGTLALPFFNRLASNEQEEIAQALIAAIRTM